MFRRPICSTPRAGGALAVVAGAMIALTGCAASPTATPSTLSPAPTTTPAEADVLMPGGSAADNLPVFTAVTDAVWASEQRASGRAYIDALTAAGFDRAAMQVTQDQTTVGNPVESMQFSVRWGDAECLVGQVGPSTGRAVTTVVPQLAEGRCLVGETRPIDW